METVYEQIRQKAKALGPQMAAWRKDFHTYAEVGWFEVRTSSIIADHLTKLGYQVLTGEAVCRSESRMGLPSPEALELHYQKALSQGAIRPWAEQARGGHTGVIGILDCGEGPTVALRFDIDALGVVEDSAPGHRPAAEGFCSVNPGSMHACGHDGHAAIGMAVARILMEMKDLLHGRIKLIFQPAEEGLRGAKPIVDQAHLDGVDYVIANHMGARGSSSDDISLTTGSTLASSKLDVTFTGRAAHAGASPEKGCNALLAAATAVLNLQAIPRHGGGISMVNVGTLHAGTGRNVVCDRAVMELEVRGADTEINNYMELCARRILQSAADMHGCTCDIRLAGSGPSLRSDAAFIERCVRVCTALGLQVAPIETQDRASEDYSYMVDRVRAQGGQGLFFRTLTPIPGPNHSRTFDIQEADLPNGAMTFCALVYDLMGA